MRLLGPTGIAGRHDKYTGSADAVSAKFIQGLDQCLCRARKNLSYKLDKIGPLKIVCQFCECYSQRTHRHASFLFISVISVACACIRR